MSNTQRLFLVFVSAGLALTAWGWVSTPGVSTVSAGGASLILFVYALAGYWGVPYLESIQPPLTQTAVVTGLIAGLVFAGETALEYALLPRDNTSFGVIEFSLVFVLVFAGGLAAALRVGEWRKILTIPVGAIMLASLIWAAVTLFTFYVFRGTPPQQQVLFAEGSFDDFVRSGMTSFDVFIMEDLFGAVFFHLLLGPLMALLLGLLGGGIGMLWRQKHAAP